MTSAPPTPTPDLNEVLPVRLDPAAVILGGNPPAVRLPDSPAPGDIGGSCDCVTVVEPTTIDTLQTIHGRVHRLTARTGAFLPFPRAMEIPE